MKILLSSHFFYPSIGGLEEVSFILAEQFTQLGHEVKVVTQSVDPSGKKFDYEVVRRPGTGDLFRVLRWSDVLFHNNVSMRTAWPLFFCHRPWVITHQTWTARADGRNTLRDDFKHFTYRYATNVAISQAVAAHLRSRAIVIGNPYRAWLFGPDPAIPRDRDLVFLGRLVSQKGADLLLDALAKLKAQGLTPNLTFIGGGAEEMALRKQTRDLGLESQVTFAGPKRDVELVNLICAHRIMVVPSRWEEPFGVVALEGAACGCVVVGSQGGGLKDAIGEAGLTFPNGNVDVLADQLRKLLTTPELLAHLAAAGPSHVANFHPEAVAKRYLEVFSLARGGRK
ncbi:MAG: glycosyltransferase family 4 protein [Verrucomicrobia bacterium]|nr:glycosyltransferase family 4 protein [Verrucomicrobiota bacterium]